VSNARLVLCPCFLRRVASDPPDPKFTGPESCIRNLLRAIALCPRKEDCPPQADQAVCAVPVNAQTKPPRLVFAV